jgi:hypothetical protein
MTVPSGRVTIDPRVHPEHRVMTHVVAADLVTGRRLGGTSSSPVVMTATRTRGCTVHAPDRRERAERAA